MIRPAVAATALVLLAATDHCLAGRARRCSRRTRQCRVICHVEPAEPDYACRA